MGALRQSQGRVPPLRAGGHGGRGAPATEDNQIHVAEIWSYHVVGDEPRFTLVHRNREAISAQARSRPVVRPVAKPVAKPVVTPIIKGAATKPAAPKPAAKPVKPKPKPVLKPKAKAPKPKKAVAKKKK